MSGFITMHSLELSRLEVITKVIERRITQQQASNILNLSERQVRRLVRAYNIDGAAGLKSKHRDKPSNHQLPANLKQRAIDLICKHYSDFGPTFAAEKLSEKHDLFINKETIRQLMIQASLWKTRNQKRERAYQPRNRRSCVGDLIQIDGSDHEWFEKRGPRGSLLVYIDDATRKLMHLKFVHSESTLSYFEATKEYLNQHGKPVSFYSDKHSVFRVYNRQAISGNGMTHFGRALHELNIDIICANSSQAKGRVERANLTLQDRLVKELRLANVSDMDSANIFVQQFILIYNQKFAKPPLSEHDSHRELQTHENLENIFTWQEDRTLSKNLTLQYDKVLYLIKDNVQNRKLGRKRVTVIEYPDGAIKIIHMGVELSYAVFDKLRSQYRFKQAPRNSVAND